MISADEMPDSDPFAGADPGPMSVLTPPNPDGLSTQQLENMLSDLRFQPKWREESSRAADYYDGHQLTPERLQRMSRLGIPPLVTNLIRPTVDAVLGLEAKTRTDWRVTEDDSAAPVPEPVLNALNQKLNEAERETRADRSISDAHASQIKAGIGWVEVARATDAMDYPYRVATVHRDEMWWDWRSKRPDLFDARYLVRKRRFDQDELIALMPEHSTLIRKAVAGGFRTWQWETRDLYDPRLSYAAEVERVSNLDEDEWRDAERKRATLFEVWYRKWRRGPLLRLPNGRVIPFDQNNMKHLMAVQAGVIQPFEGTYTEMRVAFFLGPHVLYDFKSPYSHRHFPYVPFWGYREDKSAVPYGLIRSMMSPQDVVNSADARMHWMLNARRLLADSDAIDQRHNSWQQVQDELARPDAVVLFDPSKPNSRFKVEQDFQLTNQQYQRRMQAANDIENAGGVFKAMLGKEGGATSGIAINALIEQGSVTLAEINDNYRFARRQVGELLFNLVYEDMLGHEVPVRIKPTYGNRVPQTIVLNQQTPEGVQNNLALVTAKVVLNDVPSTPAFRAQQLQVLSEVIKSLPPEMQMASIDVLVKLTDVPEKELLIQRLRRMAGIQDLAPEEQAAADEAAAAVQQEAAELAKAAQVANIENTQAKTQKLLAETEKVIQEAENMELDLQGRIDGIEEGDNAENLRAELEAQMGQIQQMRLALQDKAEKLQADARLRDKKQQSDAALKKYEIDQNTAVKREQIAATKAVAKKSTSK
jgi:hypothetical protein